MTTDRPPHTWASHAATLAAVPMAFTELSWSARADHLGLAATAWFLVLVTLACLARLVRDNCFEARLGLVVLSAVHIGWGLLAVSIGLPGAPAQRGDATAVAALATGTAVLLLLAVDAHLRRQARPPHPPSLYAR